MKVREKKKIITAFVVIAILAAALWGISYLARVSSYQRQADQMTYSEPKLKDIPDGTYTGSCDVDFVAAEVAVTVKDGVIADVRLISHKNDRGAAAEVITSKIVEEQKVDVDAVSGATNSSKVIKKAVENALIQGEKTES